MNIIVCFVGLLALASADYRYGHQHGKGTTYHGERCAVTADDPDADCIKGLAGKDYPTLERVPKETAFVCPGRGLFADVPSMCQLFHTCHEDGRKETFLCPVGSMFNQKLFTCDYWFNVDCARSESLYSLNKNLYKAPKPQAPVHEAPKPHAPVYEEHEHQYSGYEAPEPQAPVYEQPQPQYPGYEAPEPQHPGYEAPEPQAPVYYAPKPQAPVYYAPKPQAPVYYAPKPQAPVYEAPKPEAPKPEAPVYEAPKPEAPKPEAPVYEAPKPEAPKPEAPVYEAPKPQAPVYEAPEPQAPHYLPPTPELHIAYNVKPQAPVYVPAPHFPKEKCTATKQDPDADCIQGTSGKDYPHIHEVPKETAFVCPKQGIYADVSFKCAIYHVCHLDGRKDSFLCPMGSIFNQQHFTCDYWYNVDCSKSESFYGLNKDLYKVPDVKTPQPCLEHPEQEPMGYGGPEPQQPQKPHYHPHPPPPPPQDIPVVIHHVKPEAPVHVPAPVYPKEKCAATKQDPDADCIQGVSGTDYPHIHEVPKDIAFVCPNHGMYADVKFKCAIYHVCHQDGRRNSFLCPMGSIFNQQHFTCDYWYNVDCSKSESFYGLNKDLYKVPEVKVPEPCPEAKQPQAPVAPVYTKPTPKPYVYTRPAAEEEPQMGYHL